MAVPLLIDDLKLSDIFDDKLTRFTSTYQQIVPGFTRPGPADPIYHVLGELAYCELIIRQKINHAALAQLLTLTDELDYLLSGMRLETETSEEFRARLLLRLGAASPAGPREMYRSLAIVGGRVQIGDVIHRVLDAAVQPENGKVVVYIQPSAQDSQTVDKLVAATLAYLSQEAIKPALDDVQVKAATPVTVNITADVRLKARLGQSTLDSITESLTAAWKRESRLGWFPSVSWITRELHTSEVDAVKLKTPISDPAESPTRAIEYPVLGRVTLNLERAL